MANRELTGRAKAVKEEFIRLRGFWVDEYDAMAILCPDFLEKLVATGGVVKKSSTLSPLLHHLVAVALDASITHLFDTGTRLHMRAALALGGTREQLVEVIQIVSFLGMQSHLVGLPIILDLVPEGDPLREQAKRPMEEKDEALKSQFAESLGVWTEAHDLLLALSDDYFPTYLEQLRVPYATSALTPREKALVLFAANVSVTHLNEQGIRTSATAALASGCSGEDLLHVIRLASSLGMQSCVVSFPILVDELEAAGALEVSA
ncbi:carboxymuconolactone decarboxylase family protein [Sphingobium amiense]|uniref:Carboxymuconolactone decarboxylase family protein n=2 Tax=Sphingobium amiense TaxID=135719 RepID=A0A494W5F0_9SPHN|nr:carboxymuconolactone decarboxylase family protein [Sphingobium amiense]